LAYSSPAAVFDYDYRDMQFYGPLFTSPVGVLFGITNVGNARVRGAEADAWWRPAAGLDLRFGVGTIDTKITKSIVAGVTTGSNLPNAPKLTLNGMVRYQWALNNRLSADVVVSEALYSSVGWGYDYGSPRTYGINFSYKL
jgi:iron complex outermembrane receptor protein